MSTLRSPVIISLEGNIGAGKSTLLDALEQRLTAATTPANSQRSGRWLFLKEPVHIWNTIQSADGETLLSKFYADPAKYAFAFQIMAFTTRLSELQRLLRDMPADCPGIICERSLDADKHIFAKMLHADGLIEDVLFDVYSRYFAQYQNIGEIDLSLKGVIYVDADPSVCFDRIVKRSRDGEVGGISLAYLEKCRDYHETWLQNTSHGMSLLRVDTNSDASFDGSNGNDPANKWLDQITLFLENHLVA
jgi:deoxyadenosine/deoxycytidine kinase